MGKLLTRVISSSFPCSPTPFFYYQYIWVPLGVCTYALWVCKENSRWSSCVCVCMCILWDFGVHLSIIHNTAGQFESLKGTLYCERAEILCLCQARTWTALQSTPLRAAILERLAWTEIAA